MKRVGIWIDHRRAIVVTIDEGRESHQIIESERENDERPNGGRRSSTPYGPQAGSQEHQLEAKERQRAIRFYKEVILAMGKPDELLVMGPAGAKREFVELLEKQSDLRVKIKMETTDRMTEAQVAAKVRTAVFPTNEV
jgi:hypothetical protein